MVSTMTDQRTIGHKATYYLVSSAWNGLIQLYEYCSLDKAMGKFASEMNDNVWDIVKLWKISSGRFWSEKREVLMQQSHREIYRAEEEAEFIHV
jgi:hypothetical protein